MRSPTSFEPVKATKRVLGWVTSGSPTWLPRPGMKFSTPGGSPTSSMMSANLAAMVGESLEGFNTTVFPVTMEAVVIPTMMAAGKFHGGITAPTPSGMYFR